MKTGRKSWLLFTVVLALAGPLKAQHRYEITVKEAVDIAFKNVNDLKNAKLDYKIAAAKNQEITGMAYPQIAAAASGNHYFTLPLIQFPDATETSIYDVLKKEGVRDRNGNIITGDGQFNVRNFSFLSPWNVQLGATVQQLLFEPQVFVGLMARKAILESSDLQIKVAEDKVREAVYKSYYAVLISEKQLKYVQESLKRLEKLSHDMEIMYQNGFVEKLDIDKSQVARNNTRAVEGQLKNGIAIGYAVLKMNMGLGQADTLSLKDTLTASQLKEGLLDNNFKYENRNEIQFLNKNRQLQTYDVRRYKLSYFPTVSAFYNLQRTGQRNSASKTATTDPWFWYTTNQVGLSVNVPIFDGFQKRAKIRQAQLTLEKVDNAIDQAKKGIDLELSVARNTLVNALSTLDVQEENMKLAEKVYNSEKKKYEVGTGSSFTILNADTELQQAQSNYFRALYDAIIARVSYLKALGTL
jgi:outer membrane protein TolC